MVLVDTSVWIRFLAGKEPYARSLDRLLGEDHVLAHDLVYGELSIGDRGGRSVFLSTYARTSRVASIPHADVVTFVRARRLHGLGLSWIDVHLLASATVADAALWTADTALQTAARTLGIAHDPA